MDTRPPKPDDWEWISICSAHPHYKEDCGACNAGRWVSAKQEALKQWLYERNYKLWFEWVNRPDSEDRKFLEKTFPNLAKGGR